MSSPNEAPKLPKLPFIIADVALLGLAVFIALQSSDPYAGNALIAIVACVAMGAVALVTPFIADYGRKTDALLSDRQDRIVALAQATAASVEQVNIAATSLNAIAESSTRSAKAVETLPHRLQEKIAEFKAQLNEVTVSENEALEQELQVLRSVESDRLVAAVDQLAKTASDLTRLETLARTQATHAAEALASLPKVADQAAARATESIAHAASAAKAELDRAFTQHQNAVAAKIVALNGATAGLETRIGQLQILVEKLGKIASLSQSREVDPTVTASKPPEKGVQTENKSANATPVAEPPKSSETTVPVRPDNDVPTDKGKNGDEDEPDPSEVEEEDVDYYDDRGNPVPPTRAHKPAPPRAETPRAQTPVIARAEAPRGVVHGSEDERASDAAISADGATRLLVTAYIGIGNKLFLRGAGPGLSWERGVPLQFVSIGKWRWDTMDASEPITGRLYKNDQIECATVGMVTIEPGYQRELIATF